MSAYMDFHCDYDIGCKYVQFTWNFFFPTFVTIIYEAFICVTESAK